MSENAESMEVGMCSGGGITIRVLVLSLAFAMSAQAQGEWPNGPDEDPCLAYPNDPGYIQLMMQVRSPVVSGTSVSYPTHILRRTVFVRKKSLWVRGCTPTGHAANHRRPARSYRRLRLRHPLGQYRLTVQALSVEGGVSKLSAGSITRCTG